MKNIKVCSAPVPPRMRVSTTLLFVIAAVALMLTPVCAQVFPLSDGNSSVLIDVASPVGMHAWVVDGIPQLNTQWWHYRIGDAETAPINAIGVPVPTPLSPRALSVLYSSTSVDLTVNYSLTGGPDGSGNSTIAEVMRIKNKTTAPMVFHLFEYTDLNLNDTCDDDTAALLNASTVGQWDGAIISTELASVGGIRPGPNRWEVANAQSLLAKLNSGAPFDLANATTPFAGDAAFAFQWDLTLPAGYTQILSKSKILMRGGAIGDTVWCDGNANGTQDGSEPGVPGVTVNLAADFNGDGVVDYTASAVTDENGYYLFANLPAGLYSVDVDATTLFVGATQTYDYDGLATPNIATLTLADGEVNLDIDFGYTADKPGILIEKTGPATACVGETITYHFKVTNTGNSILYDVTVNDPLLGGVIWTKAFMVPGEVAEFEAPYVVDASDLVSKSTGSLSSSASTGVRTASCWPPPPPSPKELVNTATVTGDPPCGASVTSTSSWTTTIGSGNPKICLVKTGPATACVGDTITYHFKVTNTGDTILHDVTVNDPLLGGVIWTKASMAPDEVAEFDATYVVDASDLVSRSTSSLSSGASSGVRTASCWNPPPPPCPKVLVNTATVTGDPPCGPSVTSTSSWTTTVGAGNPKICLVKTGPATANNGDTITYHFKVTNTGDTVLDITVDDPLLGGVIWHKDGVAPGAVNEFDHTYLVSVSFRSAKCVTPPHCPEPETTVLTNTATATGRPPTGCSVTSTSSCKTTITCTANYTTYTQGGWGAPPCGNNAGALLKARFSRVYPSGCVAIGGNYKIKFTGASAIKDFLPQGGTPGKLRCSATNPSSTAAGVFAGQVLALRLNVDFSTAGVTTPGLGAVKLTSGKLAGKTIAQVLALAEQVLGGSTSALPSGMSISQLNDIVDGINNRYD